MVRLGLLIVCQDFLVSTFIKDIGLYFSFLLMSKFRIKIIMASYNEWGGIPFSSIFWINFWKVCVISYLNCWNNSWVYPSGPGLFYYGNFLKTFCFQIIIHSKEVVFFFFKCTGGSCVPVSPNGNTWISIVQYWSQEIDIGTMPRAYWDFTILHALIYVCVHLHMYV